MWFTGGNGDQRSGPDLPPGVSHKWNKAPYAKHWTYRGTQGETLGHVVRYEGEDGKQVVPFFKANGRKWKAGASQQPRPLYGLQKLGKTQPETPALIVEGEKAADAAQRLVGTAYVTVTWPGGTNAVKKADWSHLQGRDVKVWPDADNPGRKAAESVAEQCREAGARSVGIVNPPQGKVSGWDLADGEAEGWTGEQVKAWLEERAEDPSQEDPKITICTLGDIAEQEFSDNPLIHNLLDENESLLLCGQSGIGKSLLTLLMALILGRVPATSLWGKFTVSRPLRSLVVQSENPAKAMNKRLRLMAGGDPDLKQGIDNTYLPVVNGDCRLTGELTEEAFRAKLIQLIQTVQADILILDPLISYTTGDENDNAAMRHSLDCLTDVQDKTGTASIVVHHLGKAAASGDFNDVFSGRGASAIGDWAANILTLKKEKQEDSELTIEALHHKARNFELQPPFYLKRTPDLQFHLCERPGTKQDQHVQAAIDSLDSLGGEVSRQSELEAHIIEQANIGRQTARRGIQRARELGMIHSMPGKGNATGLKLGSSGSKRD
jgi:hypothetical protein